jgi:hypothetical protein
VQLHISRVNSLDEQEKIAKLVKTALNFVKISIEDSGKGIEGEPEKVFKLLKSSVYLHFVINNITGYGFASVIVRLHYLENIVHFILNYPLP